MIVAPASSLVTTQGQAPVFMSFYFFKAFEKTVHYYQEGTRHEAFTPSFYEY